MFDSLTTIIWFLVAICILVAIHEYGHFIVARLCGVKVLRFSIGFGKRLLTWNDKHGTEYALSAIPLGGYVKMLDEREMDIDESERHLSFNSKSVWQRIAIAAAGPIANFILALFIYWVALFIQGTVSVSPVIGKIEPGSVAEQARLVEGQEIIAIDGEPTPTRRAVTLYLLHRLGESGPITFTTKYPDSSLKYESEAQLDNWLRGSDMPDPIQGLGIEFYQPPVPTVAGNVSEGSAAEKAGLLKGDQFISMDGIAIESWEQWASYVRERPSVEIVFRIEREGEQIDLRLVPETMEDENGKPFGRAGIYAQQRFFPDEMVRRHSYSFVSAASEAVEETWDTGVFVLVSMRKLIFGEISTKNLSGPIGIAKVAASHAEHGFWAFLSFLAHMSIVLGVLNLLPIPILDGGHIVYCLVEWIKGSPVSRETQYWATNVGMIMIFGVMIMAFYNDILRL